MKGRVEKKREKRRQDARRKRKIDAGYHSGAKFNEYGPSQHPTSVVPSRSPLYGVHIVDTF